MTEELPPSGNEVDAITDAVLTASRLLVGVSAKSVAAVAGPISLPQFRLLVALSSRGPLKLVSLAELLGVNPSTATRTVDRLVGAGWAERNSNPESRREITVGLTGSGRDLVDRVTEYRRREIAAIVQRMPAHRREGLVEALQAFTEAGAEPPARTSPYDAGLTQWD
ncbi:DNA-binding MarR family transcriptional regulator [Halopolyspora algeriensis]|uniref:DNA-binding MarR family transcriptional regulator n=1 Tax=Halopolyspora algeriensis TaxID=1500506 RepID=A0A368VJU9_9ACTN|nr:MarR family transcriptional regulator [Halopolyspora algeriensis]RCW40792.1 DNA-binding MarR family transcriptional regulator [Halopolyspora algeriensis]TQM53290.1 DNA-binding MarR family transcriptional regulator [Halopolyspora algeriensis]